MLDPHRCSPELSTGSRLLSAHTLRASRQVERYVRVTVDKGCRSLVYLSTDGGTMGNYGSISLWLRTTLERELPYRHQARPWAGVQYVRVVVTRKTKPKWATGHGTKGWPSANVKREKVKLLNPGVRV